jgi:glycosyltransferase involved in cell wall biosynthesis
LDGDSPHARSPGRERQAPLRVVIVGCAYDARIATPDELLERYHSLTSWAQAVAADGSASVAVAQRFSREASLHRGGIEYRFIADGHRPYPPSWFWGHRIARAVRDLAPTVVHFDGLVFPVLVRHLALLLAHRAAILVQDHGGGQQLSRLFDSVSRRRFYRWGLAPADGFLFTSLEQAGGWRRAGIIGPAQPVYQIPESSTDLVAGYDARDEAPRLPGRPAALWVGRLDANKDPLTVLDGFERAAASLPDAALTVVFQEDALLPRVKDRIAASRHLRERVHLQGKVDRADLAPIYAGADLFVLGSHSEGSGYALIEALASGVTPVVTDIPSFRVLTDDGRLGALFAPGDAADLARAFERVARLDLAARRSVVRAYFQKELSWPAVGRRALEIYRAASEVRTGPAGLGR